MNGMKLVLLIWSALAAAAPAMLPGGVGRKSGHLDKTWTTAGSENTIGSQALNYSGLTSRVSFQAEGMGFEPTTPCGAPDFESGRWPIRLPSGLLLAWTNFGPTNDPTCGPAAAVLCGRPAASFAW